jgi:hypothetical protein
MQDAPGTDVHGRPQLQLPSVWHTQNQGSPSAHEKCHEQLAAKRTVQRYMQGARPRSAHRGQTWATFLRNQTVWASDFLQAYDLWFRPIFAFFIIDVNAKRVVHVACRAHPKSSRDRTANRHFGKKTPTSAWRP